MTSIYNFMIDLNFLRDNLPEVKKVIEGRGVNLDLDVILKGDQENRELIKLLEDKRSQLNKSSKTKPSQAQLNVLRELRQEIKDLEQQQASKAAELQHLIDQIPNMVMPNVPLGGAEMNKIISQVGQPRQDGLEHWQLPGMDKLLDAETGAKISGSRFVYLNGDLAKIYYALMRFAQDLALKHGYQPVIPPILAKHLAFYGSGFFPANEQESYRVNSDEATDLYLIGTSESVLVAKFAETILDLPEPIRLMATTTCFRREAGTYGKDIKGLFRLHQFDKVEMVTICQPEVSEKEQQKMLAVEEDLFKQLGLPYRVVLLAAGDAAPQSAKTYDCEGWFAGQKKYRELTSCSNCIDFQSRRLKIRFRMGGKQTAFTHTLNGTVCSMGRPLACIIEHYQTDKGFKVPKVLQSYCGLKEVITKVE